MKWFHVDCHAVLMTLTHVQYHCLYLQPVLCALFHVLQETQLTALCVCWESICCLISVCEQLGARPACHVWCKFFSFDLFFFFFVLPQYYGTWSSEKVKSRVTEIIFSWTVWFPQEVKIRDAYQMLKKQGSVLLFQFPS